MLDVKPVSERIETISLLSSDVVVNKLLNHLVIVVTTLKAKNPPTNKLRPGTVAISFPIPLTKRPLVCIRPLKPFCALLAAGGIRFNFFSVLSRFLLTLGISLVRGLKPLENSFCKADLTFLIGGSIDVNSFLFFSIALEFLSVSIVFVLNNLDILPKLV